MSEAPLTDPGPPPFPDMVWIPGGTFRMGSDKHYPEERPVHRVRVDGLGFAAGAVRVDAPSMAEDRLGHLGP